jgi:hypothetical protein
MATNHDIINELRKAYAMELETVRNYLANAIDLDGVRADELKKARFLTMSKKSLAMPGNWATGSRCSRAGYRTYWIWIARSDICNRPRTALM